MVKIQVPLTWKFRVDRYRLIATKCSTCGRVAYPASQVCRYCGSDKVEKIELINEKARLLTWTVIYSVMEGFEEKRPLIIGLLETINSGAKIMAPLTDVLPEELKAGMLMEPVLRRISDEEHNVIEYGISYRPVIKNE